MSDLSVESKPQIPGQTTIIQSPEQKEFMDLMNKLFLGIHEVVYTSNLLDDDVVEKHPELQDLKRAVRNLGKVAWEFQKLVRKMATR